MDKRFTIQRITEIGIQGPVVVDVVDAVSLEYHGGWMDSEYVTVTVKSPAPVDFHVDDFVLYRGDYYALSYDPNVVKKAARNTYGEGFTYDNIKLYSIASKFTGYGFKDFVLEDNGVAYSSLGKFSFFAASVEDLADRIQANVNRQDIGVKTNLMQVAGNYKVITPNWARSGQRGVTESEWEAFFGGGDYGIWGNAGSAVTLGETDVNIDIDNQSCWDAMKLTYTKFGLTWYTKCTGTITYFVIGAPAVVADKGDSMIFRYGRNLGLYEIERTSPDDQELITRMYAYGSEKNLPLNYYANIGKKMFSEGTRATISTGVGRPAYGLATTIPSSQVKPAVTNVSVTLQYGNNTVVANCDTYTPQGSSVACVWWYFNRVNDADIAFYDALGEGEKRVYVIGGADMNKWPTSYIELPQDYNYPALLSINKLMLPGFPQKSLTEWLEDCEADASQDRTQYGGLTQQDAAVLLEKYIFSEDSHDPWIMSKNVTTVGVVEGTADFDGSRLNEICPTIEGTGYNVVGWGSLEVITDNGFVEEGGTFPISMDKENGLNWKDLFDTRSEDVVLTMTSGYCLGMDFKVVKVDEGTYKQGGHGGDYDVPCWVLTCERKQDSQNRWMPYSMGVGQGQMHVLRGDTFVATGIQMPDEYIIFAAKRLLIAACGWLDRRDHVRYTYLPKVDEIYMARQDEAVKDEREAHVYGTVSLHDTLRAGMRMEFEDAADLGIERYGEDAPFIDVLTIREDGNNGIPTYDVVLRDEKERGTLEKLTERIEELTGATEVVERTRRVLQYIEYDEWERGKAYYHEAMNVDEDRLEQSYVWHRGKKWMCLRSLTTEEPQLGCNDWKVVEGDTNIYVDFEEDYQLYDPDDFKGTLTIICKWGTEDITSRILQQDFVWTRYSEDSASEERTQSDTAWNNAHSYQAWPSGRKMLTLQQSDLSAEMEFPSLIRFRCDVTVRDGNNDVLMSDYVQAEYN